MGVHSTNVAINVSTMPARINSDVTVCRASGLMLNVVNDNYIQLKEFADNALSRTVYELQREAEENLSFLTSCDKLYSFQHDHETYF